MTLDKRLTSSSHFEEVSRITARRMGLLVPLLNRRRELSKRNGVLLYKLIGPLMDYAFPVWRFAALTYVRKLHILQSKCFFLVTGFLSNMHFHENLGV
jgi:hypothetical protein